MSRLSRILGVVVSATLLSAGVAAAASLGIGSSKLAAGRAVVSGCTAIALTTTRNVNNTGNVTQVNLTNVPQACAGETVAVTLENSSHASLGSASATVGTCTGGCAVAITGFGTVTGANLTGYAFSISG
jgi:hypothetical protein